MYATVVPALRLPRRLNSFTYSVPKPLQAACQPGAVVRVPWRTSMVDAVVIRSSKVLPPGVNKAQLKSVESLRWPTPLITQQQQQLMQRLAETYCVSLGTVLKMLLPSIPKRAQQLPHKAATWATYSAALSAKRARIKPGVHLAWYRSWQQRADVLSALLNTIPTGQVLVVVPERADISAAGMFIPEQWRADSAVLAGETAKNRQWATWQAIRSGSARLIIGTRSALFAPFADLRLIIVDDEADDSLKQWDQNPRYDARRVAEWLAADWRCPLVLASAAPRPETYAATVPDHTICTPQPRHQTISVVDLRPYSHSGDRSLVTEPVRQALLAAHERGEKSALFLNRRGLGSSVSCRDCGTVCTCGSCQLPLTPHRGGMLDCHRCGSRQPMPVACTHCNGSQFWFAGQGSETLERELQTLWPGARVLRLDADNHPRQVSARALAGADLYVGTDLMTGYIPWPTVGAAAIIYCDNLFTLPHWRSTERSWRYLSGIAAATAGSVADTLYVQTWRPDNTVMNHFSVDTAAAWYTHELNTRRDFHYPPFGQLTALIVQAPSISAGQSAADRLFQQLTAKVKQDTMDCIIQPPQLIFGQRVRGQYRVVISIKHAHSISPLLALVPDNWLIDVDPLDIM